jgi:riboflavin synthase
MSKIGDAYKVTPYSRCMFTGIVECTARVLERTESTLKVERPASFDDVVVGASIAVNGTCLTITIFDQTFLQFTLVPETWARTNLGMLKAGDRVNLERSMKASDRFEGHMVQGHIEGVGDVVSLTPTEPVGKILSFTVSPELLPYIVPKGSIAVNGVSLTVVSIEGDTCSIALIPHTLEITNLGMLKAGDAVNLETDVLMRGLKRMLDFAAHS